VIVIPSEARNLSWTDREEGFLTPQTPFGMTNFRELFGPIFFEWRGAPHRACLFGEKFKVHGIAHLLVSTVGGVKMVAAVGFGGELRRIPGIPGNRVEIDHAIEMAGSADPSVYRLTGAFPVGAGIK
jgi:hypothetical protein